MCLRISNAQKNVFIKSVDTIDSSMYSIIHKVENPTTRATFREVTIQTISLVPKVGALDNKFRATPLLMGK